MKKSNFFSWVFVSLLLISFNLFAQNPGGVSGANLWLKANDGATNCGEQSYRLD
jgi:hypothetical protein